MAKTVRIHTCYAIDEGEDRPGLCACYSRVKLDAAKNMVRDHLAEWVTEGNKTSHSEICVIGGMSRRTPRTATIDENHMDRAYVSGDLEEQTRINEYGDLSRNLILDLIRYVPKREFDAMKKTGIDIPVLQFSEDNRTPGGISEDNE